jgi:uncharacterized protein YjiS (DUF1127 family)
MSSSRRVYKPRHARLAFAVEGLRSLLEPVHAAISRMHEYDRRRRAEQDLRGISDHVLRDLGIGRSEILSSIRKGRDIDG